MKKLLALVLALVMTLSLCITTNAAYPDAADVDFDEAVEVMSKLGVFQGDEKGNFNPDATLTRETAAKIITYMLLGKKNADTLVTIAAPYADVEATRWSAGSIAYCTNEGILAGKGDGTFGPAEPLTGLAFAKMCLIALGYDAEVEGLVGSTWSINVAKLALQAGLTKQLDDVSLSGALTREQAAQMAFNTELATMVEYLNSSTITAGDVTIKTQASATDVKHAANSGYKAPATANDELMQFCEQYAKKLTLNTAAGSDDFQRPATTWNYDGKAIDTYADGATYTFEGKVTGKTMYDTVGKTAATEYAWSVYTDGADTTAAFDAANKVKSTNTSALNNCAAGAVTEVYVDTDAKTVTVCIINTYAAEVKTVKAAKNDAEAYVTLSAVPAGVTNKYETESFAKDDVVLYTVANSKIQSLELAEKVEGTVSQVKANTNFVADGTTYSYSAKFDGTKFTSFDKNADNKVVFYTDKQGNCIYFGEVETATNYAVVINHGTSSSSWSGIAPKNLAKLVFVDGTVAEVEAAAPAAALVGKVVKYSVDSDDVYTLTDASVDGAIDMTQGVSKVTVGSAVYYADDDTVVLLEKKDGSKTTYTAYTGVKAMPGLTAAAGAIAGDGTIAKVIYVANGAVLDSDTTKAVTFIYGIASDAEAIENASGKYYEVKAIADGEEETLLVKFGSDAATYLTGEDVVIASDLTTNSDGFVTAYTEKTAGANEVAIASSGAVEIKSESKSVVSLGTDRYTVADDVQVVVVEDGEMSAATSVAAAESAEFVGFTNKGKLSVIVIYIAD